MINKYGRLCEKIRVSEDCRRKLFEEIDYSEGNMESPLSGRFRRKVNAAAAVFIGVVGFAVLGITGIAASSFISAVFDEHFHIENEGDARDAVSIGTVAYPEEISATDKGITVTLIEAASDNYSVFMALKIEGDELLKNERVFVDDLKLLIDGEEVDAAGGELIRSETGEYFEFPVSYYAELFEREIYQKEVELRIGSFSKSIHPEIAHSIDNQIVAEGSWDLRWIATGNANLTAFGGGECLWGPKGMFTANKYDMDLSGESPYETGAVVKGVTLTCLRIKVEYEFPKQETEKSFTNPEGITNTWNELIYPPIPVAFLMNDGSIKRFSINAPGRSGYEEGDDQTFIYSHATNIIVDPFQVKAVLFLESDSEYIGTDEVYGTKELPLEEYYIVERPSRKE